MGVVVLGLGVAGLAACSDDSSTAPPPTSAPTTAVTTTAAPSTSTASTTASTSTTVAPPTSTSTTTPPSPTTVVAVPPPVTEVQARPGGGSGEIVVTWRGVGADVGYVVQRATAPDGPFAFAATYGPDGRVTRGDGVTNLYAVGDGTFSYVEVSTALSNAGVQRWFRVVAFNGGGSAAPSRAVCGAPPGAPAC